MDDCMKNCKQIAVIEESSSASFSKKRKFDFSFEELELASLNVVELESHNFLPNSPATSSNSGNLCSHVSICSTNESCCEIVKDTFRLVDLLEAKSFETENSTCNNNNNNNNFSRETTPSSEICGDSEEMESPAKKPSASVKTHRKNSPAEAVKMPSQAEIDEFFSASEKYEQKRFAEKYNYDIVKDMPLDGRYKWVRLEREGC